MSRQWIVNAELGGLATTCVVEDGWIAAVAPGLVPPPGEAVFDAHGGALLPGLIDHHLHLFALAAARTSLDLSGVRDLAEVDVPPGAGWIRAVGAGRTWAPAELDAHFGGRPVRVQHRSGALWMLSSAAIERVAEGLTPEERASGHLYRADARLRELLARARQGEPDLDLAALGSELARLGLTHLTDATPDLDEESLAILRRTLPQQLETLSRAVPSTLPAKIVISDHELPSFDALVTTMHAARDQGRGVAVHAVTSAALAMVIAALDEVGAEPGDRIEHAAMCDDAAAERLADLGVTVVTQPSLWQRRAAEFRAETPPDEHRSLWRHGSLLRAGVRVAVASDAPYGDVDPWVSIHAAASRDADERVAPADTVRSLLASAADPAGAPRTIHVGQRAALVVLDAPLAPVLAELASTPRSPVAATVIGTRLTTPQNG